MPRPRTRRITTATKQEPVSEKVPWRSQIVVLFADIVGCSEISNHETLEEYNKVVTEFQNLFTNVTQKHKERFYKSKNDICFKPKVRGDEGLLMIFRKDEIDVKPQLWAYDIDTAIKIALDLKRSWLLGVYNEKRISSGRLTSDIAIGIHFGQASINKEGERYRPEGYAINLTKRIESNSREGAFTHIDISEAAYDCLYFLTFEPIYIFSRRPRSIKPQGISQEIKVFEVKHHFLPTDWTEDPDTFEWPYENKDIERLEKAHKANPTNLWLAEEYIMAQMYSISKDNSKLSLDNPYAEPEESARKLVSGPLYDAGCLCVLGLILGENKKYKEELELYEEAIKEDKLYAEAYWYAAYTISTELFEKYEKTEPLGKKWRQLTKQERERIITVFKYYKKAHELKPRQLWFRYYYARELWRWGEKPEAISMLESVFDNDPDVMSILNFMSVLSKDPYLEGIEKEPRIKKIIDLYKTRK